MNRTLLLIIVAVVCFLVALLIAAGTVGSGNEPAWVAGGLLAFAAAHLP